VSPDRPYRGKRAFDLFVLALVALPAAALGALCVIAVRLTSPGPVLFRQTRVGRDGRPFEMVKFRTMVVGDNPIIPDTARITSAGRWLRRSSLDELPNLVNVARGEMSIVGPRPTLAYQVEPRTVGPGADPGTQRAVLGRADRARSRVCRSAVGVARHPDPGEHHRRAGDGIWRRGPCG
jgi:hypothetical protein